tara:strand:- start:1011 stop:1913 length:903 start_codon:yes stop_codon:yes gene_type:complete
MSFRPINTITKPTSVIEGAGVSLDRVFGFTEPEKHDPFLLLDDFRNDDPERYKAGFPWHPHRGIETITYVLEGSVEHKDSLGNTGLLRGGDVQWMTAGSGIMHQEMPKGNQKGQMHGFQLWSNLPSDQKMVNPRYQDIKSSDIPLLEDNDGTKIRVITGTYKGITGPVDGIASEPEYLDIYVPPNTKKVLQIDTYKSTFAYIFNGKALFKYSSNPVGIKIEKELDGREINFRDLSGDKTLIYFDKGEYVELQTFDFGVRFLLISGKAIKEPIAWHGPIVMNSRDELMQALKDLKTGNFIK